MNGDLNLLLLLIEFNLEKRATALDVINSQFMEPLCEMGTIVDKAKVISYSFMAFSSNSGGDVNDSKG